MQAAEPARGPLLQAAPRSKPSKPRVPYHHALDPDHADDLLLSIGQGLALTEMRERHSPEATVQGIAAYVDAVRAGTKSLTRDPSDAILALACLFGHQVCREFGWGWGHLRRTRSPGIVLISPDFRHASGPRQVIESSLRDGSDVLLQYYERLRAATNQPTERGFYVRIESGR
jgi:hypothetical protein